MTNRFNKFEMNIVDGGVSFKIDKDIPDDIDKLGEFLTKNPQFAPTSQNKKVEKETVPDGVALDVIIKKYTDRKTGKLAPKTLYGYLQNINIFKEWAEKQTGKKPFLINQADRKLISQYIDHLRTLDIHDNTIGKNYLMALNGLFDFAKTIGDYPDISAPSRGHQLVDKKKNKKTRKPFEIEDLKLIFNPKTLPTKGHPEQFWAPVIALFTGARISEICQLHKIDIGKRENFYTISITDLDEDDELEYEKRVKSEAGKRLLPIHPILIEMGFIEYIEDMKKFGGQIFPTTRPDSYGYFGKEAGRRWAKYSDKIGVTDPAKVFHSFRSTANIKLMRTDLKEEIRYGYIGHDVTNTNVKHYGEKFPPETFWEKVTPLLNFDIDFSKLKYEKGMFDKFIYKDLARVEKDKKRKERLAEIKKNKK